MVETEWLRTADVRLNIKLAGYVALLNHFHGILVIKNADLPGFPLGATRRVAPTKIIPG